MPTATCSAITVPAAGAVRESLLGVDAGLIGTPEAARALAEAARVVYLRADPSTLLARQTAAPRTRLSSASLADEIETRAFVRDELKVGRVIAIHIPPADGQEIKEQLQGFDESYVVPLKYAQSLRFGSKSRG